MACPERRACTACGAEPDEDGLLTFERFDRLDGDFEELQLCGTCYLREQEHVELEWWIDQVYAEADRVVPREKTTRWAWRISWRAARLRERALRAGLGDTLDLAAEDTFDADAWEAVRWRDMPTLGTRRELREAILRVRRAAKRGHVGVFECTT